MAASESRALAQDFVGKVLNGGDLDFLQEVADAGVVVPEMQPGVEGLKSFVREFRRTFANPEYKVADVIAEDGKLAVRFSGKATHSDQFLGIPATGRKLKLWGVMIFKFDRGKIVEFWSLLDVPGILSQLREI